jgi:hypothetical protein
MVVLSPIPQCAALPCATGVVMAPENAASGYSSWSLTGVTCERCHIAHRSHLDREAVTTLQNNVGPLLSGAVTGAQLSGSNNNPVIPTGDGCNRAVHAVPPLASRKHQGRRSHHATLSPAGQATRQPPASIPTATTRVRSS